jgi:hypothetical protein
MAVQSRLRWVDKVVETDRDRRQSFLGRLLLLQEILLPVIGGLADRLKDYSNNYFPRPRIGDIEFKVNAGFRSEDRTTPTAMLSRGRR